jgi:hypothetical protein
MRTTGWCLKALVMASCLLLHGPMAMGQRGPAQPGVGGGAGAASSTASLSGLSYPHADWEKELLLPIATKRAVACYVLEYGNGSSQPFVLRPAKPETFARPCTKDGKNETDPIGKKLCDQKTRGAPDAAAKATWSPCTLDQDHPLLMGDLLVVGIDAHNVSTTQLKILNLNITNQQGVPINPTPVRPSFGGSAGGTLNLGAKQIFYYMTWPNQLPGDTISTVSVSAIYTPPLPGDKWRPGIVYPDGAIVIPSMPNGHFYTAIHGGVSAPDNGSEPSFPSATPVQIRDGSVTWLDSGNVAPSGPGAGTPAPWLASRPYTAPTLVFDPYNGHYYAAVTSGTSSPAATDPFSAPLVTDGGVIWEDEGTLPPATATANRWTANHTYVTGDWVGPESGHYLKALQAGVSGTSFFVPQGLPPTTISDGTCIWKDVGENKPVSLPISVWTPYTHYGAGALVGPFNGHFYKAAVAGMSGSIPTQPYFGLVATAQVTESSVPTSPIVWQDSGTTPPALIAMGQPADQTLTLINLQLAQSHTLSYYNLASGVVYSSIRSRSFSFRAGMSQNGQPTQGPPIQTGSSQTVDPVLLFTVYPKPIDAERHCGLTCIVTTWPGFSFGFSLSAPASSFYAGVSLELLRNIQVVAGVNWAKVAALSANPTFSPASSTSPNTVQRFTNGAFAGLTLNISGFIQSLSGGGGGGGGKASGSATPAAGGS